MVDIKFDRMMKRYIPLSELKTHHDIHRDNGGPLRSLSLFTKNILCVQPVTEGKENSIGCCILLVIRQVFLPSKTIQQV